MKYFTSNLWADANSLKASVSTASYRKWKRNISAYNRQLAKTLPRMGRSGSFFKKHSMHDSKVLSLSIHDFPLANLKRRLGCHSWVRIVLLTGDNIPMLYELVYDQIESIKLITDNGLFSLESSRFGSWGYDELTSVRKGLFCHSILFSSGTEVSISFGKFRFKRMKASSHAIERTVSPLSGLSSAHV